MPENHKISIITVALNSAKYIESNIQSVMDQTYKNREHIIIDGNSTDGTVDIIRKYENSIDYWISEPDVGIAEAMNKGIDQATGDYVLFLNSDDYLIDNTALEKVSRYLVDTLDIYIFKVLFLYNDGKTLPSLNNSLGYLTWFKMGSCHQGQIHSRAMLLKLGKFDTNFKINFDYDLMLRAYKNGASSRSIDTFISVMRQVGISSRRDWTGFKQRYDEEKLVHRKNSDSSFMWKVYQVYWLLYIPYRFIRYVFIVVNKKYIEGLTN